VPGFWNVVVAKQVEPAQLEYLPPPPDLIEQGPSVAAPSADCFYTPGCWVYRVNRYVWRPGFWVAHRPDWVWVPDCYRWTPCGYVFVPGYWDCPLATRGVLFAPVRFRAAVFNRPRFVYTPAYVVPDTSLHTCLFVRTGRVNYYFGDYFEQRYVGLGYNSWCGTAVRGSNFAVNVSVTRATYDPLWSYYSLTYRDTPAWQTNVTNVYVGRFKGDVPRPPRTLVQQNTVIQNVTNVTNVTNNNTTVVVNNPPPAQAVIAPLADVSKVSSQPIAMAAVKADDRVQEQKQAKELRQFAAERRKVETALVDKGQAVTKDDKPRQAKLEVPQAVAVRAQAPAKPENAPPPPAAPAKKPDPKTDPVPAAKPAVKPVAPPVIDPKTGAVQQKKPDDAKPADPVKPAPKPADPVKPSDPVKPPVVTPPTGTPVTPQPPATTPKPVDPRPPVTAPVTPKPADLKPKDPPKVDPKPPVTPPVVPPVAAPVSPKPVDPPKTPAVPPTTPKPADPPKVDPKPKDPPKQVEPLKPPVVPVKPPETKPAVTAPKPVEPPKVEAPKTVAPPPKPVDPPKPVVQPPKVEAPKAPPPAAVNPAPKPVVQPPKPTTPATPPTKPKDEKKDKK
jgi:hypothetical protein